MGKEKKPPATKNELTAPSSDEHRVQKPQIKKKPKKIKNSEKSSNSSKAKPIAISSNWKALLSKTPEIWKNKNKKNSEKVSKTSEKDSSKEDESPAIWFDDVDPELIEEESSKNEKPKLTRALAIDCEMVGAGPSGVENLLARVSIVNQRGEAVLDKLILPTEKVTDYRTDITGLTAKMLKERGEPFETVQQEVATLLAGKLLIGHAIQNDLSALFLNHPRRMIRDTQRYLVFRKELGTSRPALRTVAKKYLDIDIQQGSHDSVVDARVTMRLYMMVKDDWEKSLFQRKATPNNEATNK